MLGLGSLGRVLVGLGAVLVLVGFGLILAERLPGLPLGRLPGDIRVERPGFTFYAPLATSILVSVALSLVFWLLRRR
jgi:Protein of unknown function (DUF2905)